MLLARVEGEVSGFFRALGSYGVRVDEAWMQANQHHLTTYTGFRRYAERRMKELAALKPGEKPLEGHGEGLTFKR